MPLQFKAKLTEIYNSAKTSRSSRWVAADWFDRVLFASPGAMPLFWAPGMQVAREIPGLPTAQGYDGLAVFNGHLILHYGDVLKWSDKNDYSLWIPIGSSPTTGSGKLIKDITAGEVSGTIGPVDLYDWTGELSAGQYVRIVANESSPSNITYDYFKVDSFASPETQNAISITTVQTIATGATNQVFLEYSDYYNDWTTGARLTVNETATDLTVTGKSKNKNVSIALDPDLNPNTKIPDVGQVVELKLDQVPAQLESGDYVSISDGAIEGGDIYRVVKSGNVIILKRIGVGSRVVGVTTNLVPSSGYYLVFQPYVEVKNNGASNFSVQSNSTIEVTTSVVLETLGYTASTRPGTRIPAGSILESIPATQAGELVNAGSRINGDIYSITTLADQAYILKEWSIQSIQDVGADQGTFFLRTEIHDEGLLGKYAWTRFMDRSIAFIGHKNFYVYSGGQDLQPIATSQWDTFRKEVDKARRNEIAAYHNKAFNEIWFIYPTLLDETKVLIFNYEFQTITLDEYPSALNGLTGIGTIEWELAPTWESLEITEEFNDEDKKYYQYVDEGEQEYTVIATGGDAGNASLYEDTNKNIPRLLVHGRVFSRNSRDDCNSNNANNYECFAETPDFDWGEPESFKYLDTVFLSLYVPQPLSGSQTLEVYAGARNNLDEPVRWTEAQTVSITGSGNGITRVNLVTSGRYIRLKFRSNEVDAKWQISAYRMIARLGGTY